jgi:hypothetical protein
MDSLITAAARALARGDPLGALKRVATDVLVRDSHGDKRNLLPANVDPRARAVVEQLRVLLGPIGAVAVKEEIGGGAALGMSPKRAGGDPAWRRAGDSRPRAGARLQARRALHDGAQGEARAAECGGRRARRVGRTLRSSPLIGIPSTTLMLRRTCARPSPVSSPTCGGRRARPRPQRSE